MTNTKPTPSQADVIRNNNAAVLKMIKALAAKHAPVKR